MSDAGKDYKCCTKCDSVEETDWKFDDFRGDRKCKYCHGEGEIDDSFRAQVGGMISKVMTLGMGDDDIPTNIDCPKCNGTGQCQTCGGTGRVKTKYVESDDDEVNEKSDDDEEEEDDDYDDDDDDDDYSSTYSSSSLSSRSYSNSSLRSEPENKTKKSVFRNRVGNRF